MLLSVIEFERYQQWISLFLEVDHSVQLLEIPSEKLLSHMKRMDMYKQDWITQFNRTYGKNSPLDEAKIMAHKLYSKYIASGSEFEINITSQNRMRLIHELGDLESLMSSALTAEDLLLVFEESKKQMIGFMRDSFRRFRGTPEFDTVKSLFV